MNSSLILCRPIGFSIKFDTFKSGWSIVYIEGSQFMIKNKYLRSLKIDFALTNSTGTDEMSPSVVFHLGLGICPFFLCASSKGSDETGIQSLI